MKVIEADYNGVMRVDNSSNLPVLFQGASEMSPLQRRYAICKLEHAMFQAAATGEFTPVDFPLLHNFDTPGKYVRSIFLPKGTVVVGRIHRHANKQAILQGHVLVMTEAAGLEEIRAPFRNISPAGSKRAILALEDTIWTVEHDTDLTDLALIEAEVIAKSYTELGWEDPVAQLKLISKG